MRRVLILIVYVSKYRNVVQRTYGILVLNALVALLHACLQPFVRTSDNIVETISLGMLTYAASTTAVFPNGGMYQKETKIITTTMASVYVCACVCVYDCLYVISIKIWVVVWWVFSIFRQKNCECSIHTPHTHTHTHTHTHIFF